MPSQHRETLFLKRRTPSLLVVTCLNVVREIARAAASSRELVERVRRASSRFARAVTVYTYTRIRIRIKRFTVYTVASFWRTRAEPNPPQPAPPLPVCAYASFYFPVSIDRRTNSLGLSLSVPGKRALSTVSPSSLFVHVLLLRDFIPFSTRTGAARRDVRQRRASRFFNHCLR